MRDDATTFIRDPYIYVSTNCSPNYDHIFVIPGTIIETLFIPEPDRILRTSILELGDIP